MAARQSVSVITLMRYITTAQPIVAEATAELCTLLCDILANVNDLGVLYEHSGECLT